MRAKNNKEVNSVKKTDNRNITINGDNNVININEKSSRFSMAIFIAVCILIVVTVLTMSYFCPELLANLVCFIISMALGG